MLQKSQKRGSYQWDIDGPLTHKIVYAKCGDPFDSNTFTIGQLKWILRLYPNGWDAHNKGYTGIFVQLLGMPSTWKSIFCQLHIECPQIEIKMIESVSYNKPHSFGSYISSFKQLKQYKPKQFTFTVSIDITRITSKTHNHILYQMPIRFNKSTRPKNSNIHVEWKLDKAMMKTLKTYDRPKGICSQIHNDMWIVKLFPNGGWHTKAQQVEIGLELCCLPFNASKLTVQWTAALKRHKAKQTLTSEYDETGSYHYWNKDKNAAPLPFTKFAKYDTLTVCVDINILSVEWNEQKQDEIEDVDLVQAMEASKYEVYDTSLRSMSEQLQSFENRMDSMSQTMEIQRDQINALTDTVEKLSTEQQRAEETLVQLSNTIADWEENKDDVDIVNEVALLKQQTHDILNTIANNQQNKRNPRHEKVKA
eukprot:312136_1